MEFLDKQIELLKKESKDDPEMLKEFVEIEKELIDKLNHDEKAKKPRLVKRRKNEDKLYSNVDDLMAPSKS